MRSCLLSLLLGFLPACASEAIKVELKEAVALGAVCLDGTPPVYYLSKGRGAGLEKWYVHHEGGGWCNSLEDCYNRSKTDLGSSSSYPEQMDIDSGQFWLGYFSRDPEVNPLMHNWNFVYMRYCDGGSFSGDNHTATTYLNTSLFFRGKRIREAIAKDLMAKGLADASDLIVSGCSAGGLATFLHADQWCDMLKAAQPSATCAAMPDSGFFIDYQDPDVPCQPQSGLLGDTANGNYHCGLKWTFEIQNAAAGVNAKCIEAEQEDWKCMFAEHAVKYLSTPVFALQSAYDQWQVEHVLGPGGAEKTQVLGRNVTHRLIQTVLGTNLRSGAFIDSCFHHGGMWDLIRIDGDLVSTAVLSWYNNLDSPSKRLWNQDKAFPCKECCSPDSASREVRSVDFPVVV